MYRATKPMLMSRGMRRILKRRGSIPEYIRQAVQSGTYRTPEEIAKMKSDADSEDQSYMARRMRMNVVRGTSIADYPVEYVIIQQHPPLPDPPRTPKKVQKQRQEKTNPRIDALVQKYYHRHQKQHQKQQQHQQSDDATKQFNIKASPSSSSFSSQQDTDWYYRKLLNVPEPSGNDNDNGMDASSLLSTKSVALRRAYNAAIHHYQLERTGATSTATTTTAAAGRGGGGGGLERMSEKDIMDQVDEILMRSQRREQDMAHAVTQRAQAWRAETRSMENVVQQQQQRRQREKQEREQQQQQQQQQRGSVDRHNGATGSATARSTPFFAANTTAPATSAATTHSTMKQQEGIRGSDGDHIKDQDGEEQDWLAVLQSNPRTWQALQRWSDRLQAVPYNQWTIGAATALDHWIAVTVLGLSEDTWQAVLQGEKDETDEMGPAIVAIRQALFPETVLDARALPSLVEPSHEGDEDGDEDDTKERHEGDGEDLDDIVDFSNDDTEGAKSIDDLLATLGAMSATDDEDEKEHDQQQRQEPGSTEISYMSPKERVHAMTTELQDYRRQKMSGTLDENTFAAWSRRYRETLGINSVSDTDFADALLSEGPLDQDVSDKFWDRLTACTRTEVQDLAYGMDSEMSAVASRYGVAPGDAEALWNLAVLRPLLDEFAPEPERQAFLSKYGDILLEGVPLEHLTVVASHDDENDGAVPASSLPHRWSSTLPATARVRLQVMAYRSNIDDDLYGLWREHKAGRARYEEKLFRTKRLGLTYDQKDPYLYDKDFDDDM